MKTLAVVATIVIFSLILLVELGWMAIIILPIFLLFFAASMIPMMIEGEDRSANHHLATH